MWFTLVICLFLQLICGIQFLWTFRALCLCYLNSSITKNLVDPKTFHSINYIQQTSSKVTDTKRWCWVTTTTKKCYSATTTIKKSLGSIASNLIVRQFVKIPLVKPLKIPWKFEHKKPNRINHSHFNLAHSKIEHISRIDSCSCIFCMSAMVLVFIPFHLSISRVYLMKNSLDSKTNNLVSAPIDWIHKRRWENQMIINRKCENLRLFFVFSCAPLFFVGLARFHMAVFFLDALFFTQFTCKRFYSEAVA